jgi:hypothetical protein
VSWSIVRTCERCGRRAERPIRDFGDVLRISVGLTLTIDVPGAGDGCPSCDPKVAEATKCDPLEWQQLLARGRGQRPS